MYLCFKVFQSSIWQLLEQYEARLQREQVRSALSKM